MLRAVFSLLSRHPAPGRLCVSPTGRLVEVTCYGNRLYSTADNTQPPLIRNRNQLKAKYDAVIVGAGHNGLIAASYLQKAGLEVCVLERRHIIGGAAVTEELFPGFKFSRASYVLSLLRPQIVKDLELKKHGLKVYLRNPNSYTPLIRPMGQNGNIRSLLLSRDEEANRRQIGQFSVQDAKNFSRYEEWLNRIVLAIEPLLDRAPVDVGVWSEGSLRDMLKDLPAFRALLNTVRSLGAETQTFYELLTAPTEKVLGAWFNSEPLQATLATDATIGAMTSPKLPGSGYVLLHHVMGELEGVKGAWGYVQGGMGGVSDAIARAAVEYGTNIFTDMDVKNVVVNGSKKACGVVLHDGTEIKAKVVLSNATPKVTFLDLIEDKGLLSSDFMTQIKGIDYTSPVTKINVAVNRLPNFTADPNTADNQPGPQHSGTIHLNCEDSELIHQAYLDCLLGKPSNTPMIELTIPSALDPTVAPPGCHVVQLFTQYTPFYLDGCREWTKQDRENYANTIFDAVEGYAPGFKASIVGKDVLTPCDLERVFGLTGGNIFHGAMSLDQLYFGRPRHRTPLSGLYLCGSGTHPGGGVMGSAGKLAAEAVLKDYK